MCNCLEEVSKKVEEHLKKQSEKDGSNITGCQFTNIHSPLTETGIRAPEIYQEFEYKIQRKKKNGELSNSIRKTINITHTFCPFCGKKRSE